MKKIGLSVLSLICVVCMVFGVMMMANVTTTARADAEVVLSTTAIKKSTNKDKMLLVTAVKNYEAVYEVGYTGIEETDKITAETDKYYGDITTGEKTWTAETIFGAEFADAGLIVWEINYSEEKEYTFKAYASYGNIVQGGIEPVDTVESTERTVEAEKYTVTWKNDDGSTLASDVVKVGVMPEYTGATPTKATEGNSSYTFAGWSPTIFPATEDVTYTAIYTEYKISTNFSSLNDGQETGDLWGNNNLGKVATLDNVKCAKIQLPAGGSVSIWANGINNLLKKTEIYDAGYTKAQFKVKTTNATIKFAGSNNYFGSNTTKEFTINQNSGWRTVEISRSAIKGDYIYVAVSNITSGSSAEVYFTDFVAVKASPVKVIDFSGLADGQDTGALWGNSALGKGATLDGVKCAKIQLPEGNNKSIWANGVLKVKNIPNDYTDYTKVQFKVKTTNATIKFAGGSNYLGSITTKEFTINQNSGWVTVEVPIANITSDYIYVAVSNITSGTAAEVYFTDFVVVK